ncbi:MAG: hypothetical protein LBL56_07545 [Treponema sp.]|nr:hypothetical protein [Treponema sp.]
MKKGFLGLIGVLLVFSFFFMGCDPDPKEETAKFEGTWRNQGTGGDESWDLNYTFTGNVFVFRDGITGNEFSGDFTYTTTTITFNKSDGTSWTQKYILEGNTLTLDPDGETDYLKGVFIKQ